MSSYATIDRVVRTKVFTSRSLGVLGICLGVVAFLVALPPIETRTELWPFLFGILALLLGVFAFTRGEKRVGGAAAVLGIVGGVMGALAIQSSSAKLDQVFTASLIASMLVFATPLTFAAIGGIFSERSGVVNIGLEGMMLMGAFWGIWGADKTGSWVGGLVIAMVSGGLLALVHAFLPSTCAPTRSSEGRRSTSSRSASRGTSSSSSTTARTCPSASRRSRT